MSKTAVVLTGVAREDELKAFVEFLGKLKAWVRLVGERQELPENREQLFFRYRLELAQDDIPRLRAVLDFQVNGWDPLSRFETIREDGEGYDLRYATPADEERVAAAERENRAAEQTQLNCQVST